MKKVYSNIDEVAHLWAHQIQEEAENGTGSFFFEHNDIYSYGHHFKCGSIVYNAHGDKAYILNSESYSSTTGKHQWATHSAIPAGSVRFTVPKCATPELNDDGKHLSLYYQGVLGLAYYVSQITHYMCKQHKARTCDYSNEIVSLLSEAYRWIQFWDMDKRVMWRPSSTSTNKLYYTSVYTSLVGKRGLTNWKKHLAYHSSYSPILIEEMFRFLVQENLIVQYPKRTEIFAAVAKYYRSEVVIEREAQIKKRAQEKNKAEMTKNKSDLEKWHKFKSNRWYPSPAFENKMKWHTGLRVNYTTRMVETSQGICIPFNEAKRLWKILNGFYQNKNFTHQLAIDQDGHQWAFNNFQDGILTAGCHAIPYSEMQYAAKQLNLI